jgi:hypothetical protein
LCLSDAIKSAHSGQLCVNVAIEPKPRLALAVLRNEWMSRALAPKAPDTKPNRTQVPLFQAVFIAKYPVLIRESHVHQNPITRITVKKTPKSTHFHP